MTEDDTFNALRRIPFKEMKALIVENSLSTVCHEILLEQNGWSADEYHEKWLMLYRNRNES
jgi:hypothetical protein